MNGLLIKSNLPNELKQSLLELVKAMRSDINEYQIKGSSAFRSALTKSIGVLAFNKETIEENEETEEIKSLIKLLERIEKAENRSASRKGTPLLKAASNILPMLSKM